MKIFSIKTIALFCFSVLLTSCFQNEKQKEFTIAEYEAAAKHMDRELYSLVYNQVSGSQFIGENYLIYSITTKEGKKFMLVDINAKTKKEAFDHQKLAEALSKDWGKEVDAKELP